MLVNTLGWVHRTPHNKLAQNVNSAKAVAKPGLGETLVAKQMLPLPF